MQDGFNIQKLNTHMINSIDAKISFDRIKYPF